MLRHVGLAAVIGCCAFATGSAALAANTSGASDVAQIDAALADAAKFIAGRQSSDGAWKSEVYPTFRDGGALTPHVLLSLAGAPRHPSVETFWQRGIDYLAAATNNDGTLKSDRRPLVYSVYDAASAVIVFCEEGAKRQSARDAWLKFLRERQLTESLGWNSDDAEYGGWSYAVDLPRKQTGSAPAPLGEPNLSATVFALEALRAAGADRHDPAVEKARRFVKRLQNYPRGPAGADTALDDGGFFFILGDAVRNKAGGAGRDSHDVERFHSYGSATADGFRALLLCGGRLNSPRVAVARSWLDKHFEPGRHPGEYNTDREHARQALYFYYSRSQTLAWRAIAGSDKDSRAAIATRAAALAGDLCNRQRPDGSWKNDAVDSREDDPLVATPLAVAALNACRMLIAQP